MLASLQHIIAIAGGMKKKSGLPLSIYDFAPHLQEREDPEKKTKKLEAQFKLMAIRSEIEKAKKQPKPKKGILKDGR